MLDSFQYYLSDESDEALQNILDRINRVSFKSEAADKGSAFNELVDNAKTRPELIQPEITTYEYMDRDGEMQTFQFKTNVVREFVDKFREAQHQVFVEATLPTKYGEVFIYGYVDEIMRGWIYDIKTTSNYTFPKFLHNWQHIVYSYCLIQNGIDCQGFEYTITDFSNTYTEQYIFNPERDTKKLIAFCERFIEFLEMMRDRITDTKIFASEIIPANA